MTPRERLAQKLVRLTEKADKRILILKNRSHQDCTTMVNATLLFGDAMKTTYPYKTKYVDAAELECAVKNAALLLDGCVIKYALCGGLAMQLHGSDRLTRDIDFVVDSLVDQGPERELEGKRLSFGGVRIEVNGIPVDLICRDDEFADLYDAALKNARRVNEDEPPVVTAPYLMAMKMVAGRGKDAQDFLFLVDNPVCDLVEARKVVKKFLGAYGAKEFDSMVALARLEKERE